MTSPTGKGVAPCKGDHSDDSAMKFRVPVDTGTLWLGVSTACQRYGA